MCPTQTNPYPNVKQTKPKCSEFKAPSNGPQQESLDVSPICKKQDQPIGNCPILDGSEPSDMKDFQPPPHKKLKPSNTSQIASLKQGACNFNPPPELDANDYWIPQLGLFNHDEAILCDDSYQWLNDNIIYAALTILHQQASDIYGFQSPQCGKYFDFKPVPTTRNISKSYMLKNLTG